MNGKELMESMGLVDEKYIAEAEEAPGKHRRWKPLAATASAAACLALVLLGVGQLRPQKLTENDTTMVSAAVYQTEAAAGTARMAEEVVTDQDLGAAPMMEEAGANQAVGAAPMMVSGLAEMTVQVVERTEEGLLCVVTDPGTSDYQVNDLVKIALPEEAEQEAAQPAALDAEAEPPQYEVSFLPDQGSDTITPAQWNLLEDG
ncbi:MAG: hypothetical protein MR828_09675 [Clostridiales bacterium]|nr:hypothetical protein [Clostridiales bacterium]